MLAFDIDAGRLDDIEAAFDATPKQMKLATARALKRTAGTIRRISSTGLQSELGLRNATALRRRIKDFKVGKGGTGLKLWYGANDLPLSAFKGRPKAVAGGVQFGDTMLHGAFFAKLRGKRRIFQRTGTGRWAIAEATLPVADRMMVFLEDEVFVDLDTIFFKHLYSEVRAVTVLAIGEYGR